MKNISSYIILVLLTLFGVNSLSQNTCVQIFSLVDSLPIAKVEVVNPLTSKKHETASDGKVCFNLDTSVYFDLNKKGFFEKLSFIRSNKVNKVYLLPTRIYLKDFVVEQKLDKFSIDKIQLLKNEEMFVYHAKKSEKIVIDKQELNKSTNNTRQIYGTISGLNSIQTSTSGIGTEIGVRGLSSERSSNLNIRQNGYDISADALGYPDAYYIPPAHTIEVIESVRGAGALQYGTQFGGMINYKLKTCKFLNDSVSVELNKSLGSNQFSNSLIAIEGRKNKVSFFVNFMYKKGNDWKPNSEFNSQNFYVNLIYRISSKAELELDYSHYNYLAKQPGGLTDAMYKDDYYQSIRDRNWFSVAWNLPSATFTYKQNANLEFQSKTFALLANRKALGFLGNITRIDPLQNRELLQDFYRNIGNETKVIKRYEYKKRTNILITGLRVFRGNTTKSQGEADDGYDADFKYNNPELLEGSDYIFPSLNTALFLENMFYFNDKLSLITGLRGEYISTKADGYYRVISRDLAGNILLDETINENKTNSRSFVLFSGGLSYEQNQNMQIYTNFSQNYRAINFNDLRISNPNFRVDPNLKDETGFNLDIGIRGDYKKQVTYDVSLFYLQYNNRIGFSLRTDSLLFNTYRFRSNISKSRNIGVESLFQFDVLRILNVNTINKKIALLSFLNASFVDGRYINSEEKAFENKKVEFIPSAIIRTGITFRIKQFSISYQYNFVGSQYTDATNSEFASNAISGVIPSYSVSDISTSYNFKRIQLGASIENVFNQKYFNKRAVGYPGPGIIASPPLAFYFSIGIKL